MPPTTKAIMPRILMIDLDDTLAKTDLLFEGLLGSLKSNPKAALLFPFWIITHGRAGAKLKLAEASPIRAESLPYRQAILDRIQEARNSGTPVILASASPEPWVRAVAEYLNCFDRHHATQSQTEGNLKSTRKLQLIQKEYSGLEVTYIGDAHADLVIWKNTHGAVLVNPSATLRARAALARGTESHSPIEVIQDAPQGLQWIQTLGRAFRVHQWAKNALIFLPWLLGHHFRDLESLVHTSLAFLAFSFVASTVYVINDLLDLESDRNHATKRNRPFASGALSIRVGLLSIPALLLASAILTWALPTSWEYGTILAFYGLSNLAYSFKFKKVYVLDVVLLAGFYTLRIFAGATAAQIPVSPWLLSFAVFLFFGLALLKRFIELHRLQSRGEVKISGRGYQSTDLESVSTLGIGSSLIAGLILVLYLNSPNVMMLYSNPERLWLITPVFLYWISRIWMLARRGELEDDPVSFAIKDSGTWWTLGAGTVIFLAALGWSF